MQTESFYRCDRCGVKIKEYEFILKNKNDSDNIYMRTNTDGYSLAGGYCKQCGYQINEAANISRVE